MSKPMFKTEPEVEAPLPDAQGRVIERLAALASPQRMEMLRAVSAELTDLSGLSPSDVIALQDADILLIEAGLPGFEQLVLSLAVERPDAAVIVVGDQLPGHIVRALMKLEASDVLPSNAGAADIFDSVDRLTEVTASSGGSDVTAVCWAFKGAVGGSGVTTLAIETAFDLSRRVGPGKVCLVDLNVADGMTASFLEGAAKLDLPALSDAPDRLDARLLAAWCWKHDDGVSLITAPRDPDADLMATEAAILRLLDVACSVFDFVIVDMPRHRMPWSASVMAAVDHAVIVSELTVPSLHAAADACREADAVRTGRDASKLVLNRMFPKKRFRAEFAVEQAEKAIGRDISATITSDWDAARNAVNLGQPIAAVKAKSQIVKDVGELVDQLLPDGMEVGEAEAPKKRRRG